MIAVRRRKAPSPVDIWRSERNYATGAGPGCPHPDSGRVGRRTFHVYADSARFSADAVEKLARGWSEGRAKVKVTADHGWEGVRHLRP